MGPMTFIPRRLSLHNYLCLSLSDVRRGGQVQNWHGFSISGWVCVYRLLRGSVRLWSSFVLWGENYWHSKPSSSTPSPLSIFTTTFLSSLDLPIHSIEINSHPSRNPFSLILSLYLGSHSSFIRERSCAKSKILPQLEDPGVPKSCSPSLLPSTMSRRGIYSQDNEQKCC